METEKAAKPFLRTYRAWRCRVPAARPAGGPNPAPPLLCRTFGGGYRGGADSQTPLSPAGKRQKPPVRARLGQGHLCRPTGGLLSESWWSSLGWEQRAACSSDRFLVSMFGGDWGGIHLVWFLTLSLRSTKHGKIRCVPSGTQVLSWSFLHLFQGNEVWPLLSYTDSGYPSESA